MENPMQNALSQALAAGMLQNTIQQFAVNEVPFVVTPEGF